MDKVLQQSPLAFDINGNLTSNTGGTANDQTVIADINRDVAKSQVVTRDEITGALNASITIDNRLIAAVYEGLTDQKEKIQNDKTLTDQEKQQKIAALQGEILLNEQKNIIKNVGTSNQMALEAVEAITAPIKEIPVVGTIFYNLSPVEQLAHTFVEKDSKLYFTNIKTGEIVEVDKADLTQNYAVNGIKTDLNKIVQNYLNNNPELTVRYNPTHGMVGDLLESALGKITTALHVPEVIAMNRYVVDDLHQRKDLIADENGIKPINLFHSQGAIIGLGAMQLYGSKYMTPIVTYQAPTEGDDNWASQGGTQALTYANQINQAQRFVAVGPAVLEDDWRGSVKNSLNLDPKLNTAWKHDPQDPVLYLSAPSNAINQVANLLGKPNFNSPIYIPNLTEIPMGIYHGILHMESHDVTNPFYQEIPNKNNNIQIQLQ